MEELSVEERVNKKMQELLEWQPNLKIKEGQSMTPTDEAFRYSILHSKLSLEKASAEEIQFCWDKMVSVVLALKNWNSYSKE